MIALNHTTCLLSLCATSVMVSGSPAQAQTLATSDGNWSDISVWNDGVPDVTKDAEIRASTAASVRTVTNNTTSMSKRLLVGADNNTHGVLVVETRADLEAAPQSGSWHTIGNASTGPSYGTVLQSGGYVRLGGTTRMPAAGTAHGQYRIAGGEFSFSIMSILHNNAAPSTGRLEIVNGTVRSTSVSGITVGNSGTGQGMIDQSDGELREIGSTALSFTIRNHNGADGELRGWGDGFHITGALENRGRVIADGYGVDRELNLSRFGSVADTAATTNLEYRRAACIAITRWRSGWCSLFD